MTHEMIAQEIGISKSYISRILTRIEKELTAFKRKIDATDGQYYRRYTASDLEKARRVLDDPPEWSIHIERDETRKQDALSVNFQQKGIYFCSDIDDIIEDSDSNRVEIALTRNSASEGVVVFRFLQKAPYVIRDAKIENEKLIYWLSLQGLVPKRYTTCFYDDAELTLYVKVECAG
jgi:DNA-binding MarR family transcriptional regulator